MPTDKQDIDRRDVTVSAGSAAAVTPNDSVDLAPGVRGLYVGAAGDVTVTLDRDNASVVFTGVLAGTVLPIRAKRVHTASTASNMVALY